MIIDLSIETVINHDWGKFNSSYKDGYVKNENGISLYIEKYLNKIYVALMTRKFPLFSKEDEVLYNLYKLELLPGKPYVLNGKATILLHEELLAANLKTEKQKRSWLYKKTGKKNLYVTDYYTKEFLPKHLLYKYNTELGNIYTKKDGLDETFFFYRNEFFLKENSIVVNTTRYPYKYIFQYAKECEECGYIFFLHEKGNCPVCQEKYSIKEYHTKATTFFPFKNGGEKSPLYMGIELEYENCKSQVKPVILALEDHVIIKRDGSIPNGFEIVTAPATLAVHKKVFKDFYKKGIFLSVKSNCGMHVHVDRKSLSEMQIGKLLNFLYKKENIPFVEKIAGRKYATNGYCKVSMEKKITHGFYGDLYTQRRKDDGKYEALNLAPYNTIEFRIFSPPLEEDKLFMRLEFVQALIDWTRPAICSIKDSSNWEKFKQFVLSTPKNYPYLSKEI